MLETLAAVYVAGGAIDWVGFDAGCQRGRVALPTYPFQRDSYWFAPHVVQQKIAKRSERPSHPLLGRALPVTPGQGEGTTAMFELRAGNAASGFIDDHRVFGTAIMPAAGFGELALAAGTAVFGD